MALEIKLSQKLSQSLVMTPQLQQAIKLLQLGRQDYLEVIEQELMENPALETQSDDTPEESGEQTEREPQQAVTENDPVREAIQELSEKVPTLSEDGATWSDGFDYFEDRVSGAQTFRQGEEDDRPSLEATVSRAQDLASHLIWQARTLDLNENEIQIVVLIVSNLDSNGYLACSLEELAEISGLTIEVIEPVLRAVQTLDPPGVGARDLRECLLIQLAAEGLNETLAWRIVDQHLSKLETRRYEQIAKEESAPVEEVYEAVKAIQRFEPRPGRSFADETPIYITPDIYVRKVDDEYVISLNDAGMPRLRISRHYEDLLKTADNKDKAYCEYLQERHRSATWLIKSIHQRQQTIYKVTAAIMKFQREFLDKGVSALKPLVLREIADDVGLHESTISRVTSNKYVHTPQGVFELKFFFTSGVKGGEGEVSSESVKERIREMVAVENPKKPLSDQQLVTLLKNEGIDVARRTVAKYREMVGILSSSRRKQLF